MHRLPCLAVILILTTLSGAALAQDRGTPEQRAACGPDVLKLCSRVDFNDTAAIAHCLRTNRNKLSKACLKALTH